MITQCVLVALVSAHAKIIQTDTLRITGLKQPAKVIRCETLKVKETRGGLRYVAK